MAKKGMMLVLAALFSLSLVLSGCGSSGNTAASVQAVQKHGKNITVAVQDNFVSMDPGDTNDTLSFSAEKTMMEGLIGFDREMKMVPVLATSWQVSPDAKEYTFHLRHGVIFSDGTPFNAEAVKVNIDRLSDPKSTLKRHSLFAMVDKTVVVDNYTVKVILKQPFGAMLNNFAHPAALMVSPKALQKYGKDIARHPVGTGEYMLKEWVQGDHLTVVKNPHYWRQGYPKLDSITFRSVPENGSRIAMLKTGEADFIYPVPPEDVQAMSGANGITVQHKPSIIVDYISMNTMKKPFNDSRVRQALNYAIDKNAFIKVVYSGLAEPMTSEIAQNVQFFSPQQPYKYDLAKAKELLKAAGYPNGFDTTIWSNNNSTYIKATQFIQQQLAQVGIKVKIENMESGTMDTKIWSVQNPQDAKIQLYFGGWSPSTGDADWGIRPLLGKDMLPPKGYNTAYYQNSVVNNEIQQAIQTADPAQRKAAYDQIQKAIWQDAPWVFLDTRDNIYGFRNYLKDAYLLPDGSLDIQNAQIVR
ncbi:Solute-binding protein family 5 domain [Acididesulfobacillus acetoxydans]|uniref:Glutathione-binding protein GsiB n=1 Tax=Acididesulfobacillus acetoxydans TaxID=1561005 RepID=A0A8S0WN53_9FIRM|nr:glutathione ABC transporter substrate-binding protein [Acididesulfobacillus acetoxydans]CAA7601054.1 Solute-binding protein family 5 domain [Acididesulfobacillus acetoxydans]CEJ06928.1 Glutathione-binding protein GsiB [Acididesulfobacillus acetoxydans]